MKLRTIVLILAIWLLSAFTNLGATGIASWYGEDHRGRIMANGRPFNPDRLTCASWDYPFGTKLKVTHNGKSVIVTVTDRGPYRDLHRLIDLSQESFRRLHNLNTGLIVVTVQPIKKHVR